MPRLQHIRVSSRRLFLISIAVLITGVFVLEIGTLGQQYLNLKKATGYATNLFSYLQRYSSPQEYQQTLDNYLFDYYLILNLPDGDIQALFFECDNDHDGRVDDPATITFPDEWLRARFLAEFSRCGPVGEIVYIEYIWVYTQDQASTYLTRWFNLKPYTISALESLEPVTKNIVLVVDAGLFPDDGSCRNSKFQICVTLEDTNLLIENLRLPHNKLFLISYEGSELARLHINCEKFSLDSIERAGCDSYHDDGFGTAVVHARDLLKESSRNALWVLILMTDNIDEINSPDIHNLYQSDGICTFYIAFGRNLSLPGNADLCEGGYIIDESLTLKVAFIDIIINQLSGPRE